MTRILIVDDQIMIQEYFKLIIDNNPDYKLVDVIENAALAEMYCSTGKVDLILMDVCTAEHESGLTAAGEIKRRYPKVKIIIVTSMPEVSFIKRAKEAGCESFWYKDAPKEELEKIIEQTINGESIYPLDTPSIAIGYAQSAEFTEKELEILRELVKGKSQTEIAKDGNISRDAVKYHIRNMLQKTGYDSYVKLVIDVVEKRLIVPDY